MKERYLIINADDFGMCHSTNQAINILISEKAITTASLMVSCPWAREAINMINQSPQMDVGIHLTHTSEWDFYKWRPLNRHINTLVDEFGYFKPNADSFLYEADPKEIREEAISQIELAIRMGVDLTNIDNHMGSMHHEVDILLDLCEKYQLPLRYSKQTDRYRNPHHEEIVKEAEKKGILLSDYVVALSFSSPEGIETTFDFKKREAINIIRNLKVGVTELLFHPSLATVELKSITETWQTRQFEFDVFRDEEIKTLLKEEGITLIGWRDVRDSQRSGKQLY